jgi:7-cyano-7-deazaguanine synthase
MDKAFVLHSGGIDSSTCLYLAMNEVKESHNKSVTGLSMHYGQRHVKEAYHAQHMCQYSGVAHRHVKMAQQPPSMLTDPDQEIPEVSYEGLPEGQSPTYVPFRNGQIISYAAAIVVASLKPGETAGLYFGAHAEDAQNWAYADCTPEFIGAMANAVWVGTYQKVRLITPLEWLTKPEIILLGEKLSVPWKMTWSCYKGDELHCGVCPTCRSRRFGFIQANIVDPTAYASSS